MQRSLLLLIAASVAAIGAAAFVVSLIGIPWMPKVGSEQGERIDTVYLLASVISLVIFAIVAAASIYAIFKFRAKPDDEEDGKPIHGHTGLEVVWTLIPTLLVTGIAVWSGVVVVQNDRLPKDHMVVEVTAAQFAWSFKYPDLNITTGELVLPVDEPVELQMQSNDVIHSFWVPEWRQKQDVVPGIITTYRITPNREGTFAVVCTELCGLGHAVMRAQTRVLPQAEYDQWVADQKAAVAGGGDNLGKATFVNNGCGSCHVLADANGTGTTGPNLDEALAGTTADFVRESIVDPSAEVTEGYPDNVMPKTYDTLSQDELDALVDYLVKTTSG